MVTSQEMDYPVGDEERALRRARRLALGYAAALALAVAGTWLRFALEGTLRIRLRSPAHLGGAALAGLGLGLAGWCGLRLTRFAGRVPLRRLLAWAIAGQLCAFPALALTSGDLFSNLAYGEMLGAGKNPYVEGPRGALSGPVADLVAARWAETPSVYGPVISAVSRFCARIGAEFASPVWGAGAAFKVAMLLCALGALWLGYVDARDAGTREAAQGFAVLAFSPLLAWEVTSQAHNDGVVVLLLAAFAWAACRGRELLAVVALAAATMAKVSAAVVLIPYLVLVLRRSAPKAAALGVVALAVFVAAFTPYWAGLETLRAPFAGALRDAHHHSHSFADFLCGALEPLSRGAAVLSDHLWWIGSTALCTVLLARTTWRATSRERVLHESLVLLLAWCLTVPWFHPWYATWLLPLAAAERDPDFQRLVAIYSVLNVAQWGLSLDPVTTVAVNAWTLFAWSRLGRRGTGRSLRPSRPSLGRGDRSGAPATSRVA
jgi:alpha-1,6-mannosyltransferase